MLTIVLFVLVLFFDFLHANQPTNITWNLVDQFDFDNLKTEDFYRDSRWTIDDEPENLCSGKNNLKS